MGRSPDTVDEIEIGIVTALPVECVAARMLVDDLRKLSVPGDPNHYRVGTVPSRDLRRPHRVVIAIQTRDGTRDAASVCADMARSFPGLWAYVMCGIAGGVPAPDDPDRHVRLGDVVVATKGVVDYDHVRTVDGVDRLRRAVPQPSAALLRADLEVEMRELAGDQPWYAGLAALEEGAEHFRRPAEHTDRIYSDGVPVAHPPPGLRRPADAPRVHRGVVGSADRLLRDAVRRDALADQYQIRAVEMEGSGIAVAADLHSRQWFMVRGVADYCDQTKNDIWHPYAALVAAGYVRALLAEAGPVSTADRRRTAAASDPPPDPARPGDGLRAITDALLDIPAMRDDYQRRAILAQLPAHIRTSLPDSVVPRLHVVGLIRTCEQFPDGEDALVDVLSLMLGATSEFSRIEAVVRRNWSAR